jgi:hypothetical protein
MPKMEYTAEILRGWPADGARERQELIKQGSVLVNGDVVEMQTDGTVDKVSATANKRVGLVIRGNGDSQSSANANGIFMTPQPAKTVTAMTWSGGIVTVTVAGHGYATGNVVTIAGVTPAGYNGTYSVTVTGANTFTYALASNPGAVTVQGTATQTSNRSGSGKALVLWGNYIAKVSNYVAGAYVPGSPVTATNGRYSLANGTTDPEVGFVLRVQAASGTETAHLTIVAY